MNRIRISALPAVLVALVVAGCGGSEDSKDGSGGGDSEGAKSTLSLVAYSTPEVVYDEIIPAFRKTDEGKGVGFKTSFGASGEQSRAVEGGLKADVVSFSIEPDVDAPGRRRPGGQGLEEGHVDQGPRVQVDRVLHRPQGQPEEHQDLGRPGEAGREGRDAEPVHLGRREVEPAGRRTRTAAWTTWRS